MPKTTVQKVIFGLLMSFFMVLAMEMYNTGLRNGGLTNAGILNALRELPLMFALCFLTSTVVGEPLAARLAARETPAPAARRIFLYERGSQFDLLHSLPNAYIWVSPIPEEMLKQHQLVQRRCHRPPHPTRDVIIYPKGYAFTELDKSFIAKLTGTIRELSEIEST